MMDKVGDREIEFCCATFYQSELARMVLGSVLSPGGLDVITHPAEAMGLGLAPIRFHCIAG